MIYLIITTSLQTKIGIESYIQRNNRYYECIKDVLKIVQTDSSIKTIIVENNGERKTILDEFKCDVVYTNNNQNTFRHKGVNELLDIKYVIEKYQMKNDDVIIKLTGRYRVLDDSFFKTVKNNIEKYNAFVKFFNVCTGEYLMNDSVLGFFAVQVQYLKNFQYYCLTFAEVEFAQWIREQISTNKIMQIQYLGLECCFADDLRLLIV